MSKHTPGPWTTDQIGMDIEIASDTDEGHMSVAWVHIGQGADIKEVSSALSDAEAGRHPTCRITSVHYR
jgi:hypothetical protein